MVLSSLADAIVSVSRIRKFLLAEELSQTPRVDPSLGMAVSLDGDFEWEVVRGMEAPERQEKEDDRGKEFKLLVEDRKKRKEEAGRKQKEETNAAPLRSKFWKAKTQQEDVLPVTVESAISKDAPSSAVEEKPFDLKGLRLEIRKGAFVAIVGRVGSGKVCSQVLP